MERITDMKFLRFLLPRLSALMACFMMVVVGPMAPRGVMGMSDTLLPSNTLPAAQVWMAPASYAQVLGVLPENTPVTVLGIEDSYYRIDCYGCDGYIGRNLVEWDSRMGSYVVRCSDETEQTVQLETRSAAQLGDLRKELLFVAEQLQGVPYVYGGTSEYGLDCSGFIYYVYQDMGWDIGRSGTPQLAGGIIVDPAEMLPGDLVFFHSTDGSDDFMTHVGMYLGDGMFIHSGSSTGVAIRPLNTGYYAEHFRCARRIMAAGTTTLAPALNLEIN